MMQRLFTTIVISFFSLCFAISTWAAPQNHTNSSPQQNAQQSSPGPKIFKHRVEPHWIGSTNCFWYRNDLPDGKREFIHVDAEKSIRKIAMDQKLVAQALDDMARGEDRLETETDPMRLPFERLHYTDGEDSLVLIGQRESYRWNPSTLQLSLLDKARHESLQNTDSAGKSRRFGATRGEESAITFQNKSDKSVEIFWLEGDGNKRSYGKIAAGASRDQHTFGGHRWLIVDESGKVLGRVTAQDTPSTVALDGRPIEDQGSNPRSPQGEATGRRRSSNQPSSAETVSPNGEWRAWVEDHNIVAMRRESQMKIRVSNDGTEEDPYGLLSWSPDSSVLIAFRISQVEKLPVHWIRSSPPEGGRAKLESRPYVLPGDPFPSYELNLFHVEEARQFKPLVDRFEHEWLQPELRFDADGASFTYQQVDRGHGRFRLIEIRIRDGMVRNIIDELSDTFIWTMHTENHSVPKTQWLVKSNEIIFATEKYGWRQLILIDASTGQEKRVLTPSGNVVRGIEWVDEQARRIAVSVSGREGQDPYHIHYATADLDSGNWTWLTEENGNHTVQWSPDRQFVVATFSRVDMAPVNQLRRVADGTKVCDLETSDIASLQQTRWRPPEVFSAVGRDGQTEIWGIICRPKDFDPNRKYPIIEDIYAGPQSSYVPKSFQPSSLYESLTSLGFIVVKIDGMGTANRSKAFHDVCWHNLKDAGFPDRIAWMRAAAAKYPEIDLSRVGIYGVSAGGQNAAGAVLFHPEFYKVAVAACGCHDNRMDKASWNEQWMGYPVDAHYAESSNIDNAGRLGGKLLLIVGEMDTNVPPESTMRLVDALIRADKSFDLLVVPNGGHGIGGAYGQRRMHEYFSEHLLGTADHSARNPVER
jgi:dipeptidyl aminopeptidase/acylaminoacyl peptidase